MPFTTYVDKCLLIFVENLTLLLTVDLPATAWMVFLVPQAGVYSFFLNRKFNRPAESCWLTFSEHCAGHKTENACFSTHPQKLCTLCSQTAIILLTAFSTKGAESNFHTLNSPQEDF